jgi:hypothetical protein
MSVVYGQLAAKQAAAKALARSGKKKYEYDSDEDVEDGRFSVQCCGSLTVRRDSGSADAGSMPMINGSGSCYFRP